MRLLTRIKRSARAVYARAGAMTPVLLLGQLLLASPATGQAGRSVGPWPVEAVPTTPHTIQVLAFFQAGSDDAEVALEGVPAGKRFVVELLAVSASVPSPQRVSVTVIAVTPGGFYPIPLIPIGTFNGEDRAQAIVLVRFYIDAATPPGGFLLTRNATAGEGGVLVTLSGYLVDLPPAASVPAAKPR